MEGQSMTNREKVSPCPHPSKLRQNYLPLFLSPSLSLSLSCEKTAWSRNAADLLSFFEEMPLTGSSYFQRSILE